MAESDFNFDRWEPAITTDIARMMLRHELSDNPDKLQENHTLRPERGASPE